MYSVAVQLKTLIADGIATSIAEEGKDHAGIDGLAADEHVMAPDQKAQHGDREAGEGDEVVAEDVLARESRDQLADHAHGRQDHDVDGRMGVEPEEDAGTESDRRPASGSKMPSPNSALERHQHQRDRQHRRAQHQDDAGGVDATR